MPEMVTSLVILRKLCETLCREGYFVRIPTIRRGCWWLAVDLGTLFGFRTTDTEERISGGHNCN